MTFFSVFLLVLLFIFQMYDVKAYHLDCTSAVDPYELFADQLVKCGMEYLTDKQIEDHQNEPDFVCWYV